MHHDGIILGDDDILSETEDGTITLLEGEAEVVSDDCSSSEDGNIVEDGLTVIPESRSLHGTHLQTSTELVQDELG
jgi:hypothetical protein